MLLNILADSLLKQVLLDLLLNEGLDDLHLGFLWGTGGWLFEQLNLYWTLLWLV